MDDIKMHIIARIQNDFKGKFGIPRQSGLVNEMISTIIFEPQYRIDDALRGLEDFSHLWIIWHFSQAVRQDWSPTVRPPRLGGNKRLGVFATRSPFRPNEIGLSSVRIVGLEKTNQYGTVIYVSGADLMDGTPILDIKPYIPYCDCHTDASGGFTDSAEDFILQVHISDALRNQVPPEKLDALMGVLSRDPRPSYQKDSDRIYGMDYANLNIKFTVLDNELTVVDIQKNEPQ